MFRHLILALYVSSVAVESSIAQGEAPKTPLVVQRTVGTNSSWVLPRERATIQALAREQAGWIGRRIVFEPPIGSGPAPTTENLPAYRAAAAEVLSANPWIFEPTRSTVLLVPERERIDHGAVIEYRQALPCEGAASHLPIHGSAVRVVFDAHGRLRAIIQEFCSGEAGAQWLDPELDLRAMGDGLVGNSISIGVFPEGARPSETREEPPPEKLSIPHVIEQATPRTPTIYVRADGALLLAQIFDLRLRAEERFVGMQALVDVASWQIVNAWESACSSGGYGHVHMEHCDVTPPRTVRLHHLDASGYLQGPWGRVWVWGPPGVGLGVHSLDHDYAYGRDTVYGPYQWSRNSYACELTSWDAAIQDVLAFRSMSRASWGHYFDIRHETITWEPGPHYTGRGHTNPGLGIPGPLAVLNDCVAGAESSSDTTRHELGHWLQDELGILPGTYSGTEGSVIQEAVSDFRGRATRSSCRKQFVDAHSWDYGVNIGYGSLCPSTNYVILRSCYNTMIRALRFDLGNPHFSGQIISGLLRDIATRLGRGYAIELTWHAYRYLTVQSGFNDFLEALILAEQDLSQGRHALLLRQLAWWRSIPGYATTSPYAPSPFPESAHYYADSANELRTVSLPGASRVRLIFDPLTRFYWGRSTYHDSLNITDGQGVAVAGSPFTSEDLKGRVIEVPGSTARLRLYSQPGDLRAGFGFRLLGVTEGRAGNALPTPVLHTTPTTGMRPFVVDLDASASFDVDGSILVYRVDPGDGSDPIFLDASSPRAKHLYTDVGCGRVDEPTTVTLTLTVIDDQGDASSTQQMIALQPYEEEARYRSFELGCAGSPSDVGGLAINVSEPLPPQSQLLQSEAFYFMAHTGSRLLEMAGVAFESGFRDPNGQATHAVGELRIREQSSTGARGNVLRTSAFRFSPGLAWRTFSFPTLTLPAETVFYVELEVTTPVPYLAWPRVLLPVAATGEPWPGSPDGGSIRQDFWKFRTLSPVAARTPELRARNTPGLDQHLFIDLEKGAPSSAAFLLTGFSRTAMGPIPLPFDLGVLGAPGCRWLGSAEIVQGTAVDPAGRATIEFVVPGDPLLLGLEFFQQWAVIDPGANALGLSFSQGGHGVIGPL
jgi:hypothetical protein